MEVPNFPNVVVELWGKWVDAFAGYPTHIPFGVEEECGVDSFLLKLKHPIDFDAACEHYLRTYARGEGEDVTFQLIKDVLYETAEALYKYHGAPYGSANNNVYRTTAEFFLLATEFKVLLMQLKQHGDKDVC